MSNNIILAWGTAEDIPPSSFASNAVHVQEPVSQKTTHSPGDGSTAHQIGYTLGLLFSTVDHGEIEIETGEKPGFTNTQNQTCSVQRAYGLDESGEDGRQRPHNAESRQDVTRRQLLHQNCPRCLEDHVCDVEDGDCGRKFTLGSMNVLGHVGHLDIS